MKQKVRIYNDTTEYYRGRISDVPIKHKAIITKSIALFDDDDPCIIHQSYVIKEYVDFLLQLFDIYGDSLNLSTLEEDTTFLDLPLGTWTLEMVEN